MPWRFRIENVLRGESPYQACCNSSYFFSVTIKNQVGRYHLVGKPLVLDKLLYFLQFCSSGNSTTFLFIPEGEKITFCLLSFLLPADNYSLSPNQSLGVITSGLVNVMSLPITPAHKLVKPVWPLSRMSQWLRHFFTVQLLLPRQRGDVKVFSRLWLVHLAFDWQVVVFNTAGVGDDFCAHVHLSEGCGVWFHVPAPISWLKSQILFCSQRGN